jgi:hypothetical protein
MEKHTVEDVNVNKTIQGKWQPETELQKHKRMFDNLIELLSDLENANLTQKALPLKENAIDWENIPIQFLINWSMVNLKTINHKHTEL